MGIVQGSASSIPWNGVPSVQVGIVAPQNLALVGAATNILGIVGSASWGPVNTPVIVGTLPNYSAAFGPIVIRPFDMGTHVATSIQQGASSLRCVRVTDTTDVAAVGGLARSSAYERFTVTAGGTSYPATAGAVTILDAMSVVVGTGVVTSGALTSVTPTGATTASAGGALTVHSTGAGSGATVTGTTTGATITAAYTGSLGNSIQVAWAVSSNGLGWKATITVPGSAIPSEVFDNIVFSGVGPSVWTDVVNAFNGGQPNVRGASNIVMASTISTVGTPVAGSTTAFSGGADGASGVTASILVGSDSAPRTGMYALRSQQCSVALLADAVASAQYAPQVAFGLQEGVYMIGVTPAGDTIANAVATKQGAGISSYAFKLMFGDWIWWNDTQNKVLRLVSPQGFVAGQIVSQGPQNSTLNKPLAGVVATQKSGQNPVTSTAYAQADLQALAAGGIDVIANPCPGGFYFGTQFGINTAGSVATNGDNYTGMTNFLAASFNGIAAGSYIGAIIQPKLLRSIETMLLNFLSGLLRNGTLVPQISGAPPYTVICNATNNPQAQIATGMVVANIQVVYGPVLTDFVINCEGGQTVSTVVNS